VGIAESGGLDLASVALVIALAVGFVVFVGLGGTRIAARWPDMFHAPKFAESPLMPAVILCLGLAAFSAEIGLAAIIGAFLAGMIVAETRDRGDFEQEVAPLYAFFPPFFFVFIGLKVDLGARADLEVLAALDEPVQRLAPQMFAALSNDELQQLNDLLVRARGN
jgi:Kef-type K+ transport system membrane component KefB